MRVILARNVQSAYFQGLNYLMNHGLQEESRAGPVLVSPTPVTTVYEKPRERVLLDPGRDANPFFHHFEALWMLAGRDDAAFLNRYVGDFGLRFAESDGVIHGAYGQRWRWHFGFDQLDVIVRKLTDEPETRQCVLTMWDPSKSPAAALEAGSDDLCGSWRDRPCNTHVFLRVRGERGERSVGHGNVEDYDERVLDLTVCCRSNDVIWGAYGANAVHFGALQEYVAARVGVGVGRMYQVSNNYHAYVSTLAKVGLPDAGSQGRYHKLSPQPMVDDPHQFDEDVSVLTGSIEDLWKEQYSLDDVNQSAHDRLQNRFLRETSWPMAIAHYFWKKRERDTAREWADTVGAADWRAACVEWFARRVKP